MKTGRFVSVAAAFLLAAAFGFSQGIPSASLTGKVTTEGGVPLPGVAVTVVSPSMQGTRDVTTSGNGDYIFNLLPSGEYTVKFALSGMSAVDHACRRRGRPRRCRDEPGRGGGGGDGLGARR